MHCRNALLLFCSLLASCPQDSLRHLSECGQINSMFIAIMKQVSAQTYDFPSSGRRKLCLTFCITYTLACILIQLPYLPVLLLGRVLGGFSTSILYSAFESWLISASNELALPQSDLSSIMGHASLVNGIVAAIAGVASNQLVASTSSFSSPFVASGILLLLTWVVVKGTWTENYGSGGGTSVVTSDPLQLRRLGQAWKIVRSGRFSLSISIIRHSSHLFRTLAPDYWPYPDMF